MSDEAAYDPRSMELGFKLYPQRLRSPKVKRFVEIARRLRSVYETAESVSEIEFLRYLDGLLPELYAAAAVNGNEPDSIPADLADDLASIYVDITEWLALYDLDGDIEVDDAIWHWRFDWEHHWGPHLVHAMVAIQSLVHFHYDEDNRGFTNWLPKQ
jgi:hypothetical protein